MPALQVRHVPDDVSSALTDEAARRGVSLQTYLLEVLSREAAAARNRRLLTDWVRAPLLGPEVVIDAAAIIHDSRSERDARLAPS